MHDENYFQIELWRLDVNLGLTEHKLNLKLCNLLRCLTMPEVGARERVCIARQLIALRTFALITP